MLRAMAFSWRTREVRWDVEKARKARLSVVLLCETIGAHAAIVEVGLLDGKPLRCGRRRRKQVGGRLNVEDAATFVAEKMGMRLHHPIEVGIFAVDGEHAHHTMLHEQAKSVVNSGFGKRWDVIHQGLIDFVHGGVSHLLKQILHHGYALHGGFHAVGREIVVDLFFLHGRICCYVGDKITNSSSHSQIIPSQLALLVPLEEKSGEKSDFFTENTWKLREKSVNLHS